MIDRRSLVEVGVAMVLRDRFSNEAGRISNSFRTMMNDILRLIPKVKLNVKVRTGGLIIGKITMRVLVTGTLT